MAKTKPIGALARDIYEVKNIVGNERYLYDAANYVQAAAKLLAPAGEGDLRQNIQVTVTKDVGAIVAHIGTRLEYALYVELGTGPRGAADHSGISPDINPTYSTTSWWVHESQVPAGTAEKYHWITITTKDAGKFYLVNGQPAQPYLYPALKDNEQTIGELLTEGWGQAIRKTV